MKRLILKTQETPNGFERVAGVPNRIPAMEHVKYFNVTHNGVDITHVCIADAGLPDTAWTNKFLEYPNKVVVIRFNDNKTIQLREWSADMAIVSYCGGSDRYTLVQEIVKDGVDPRLQAGVI